MAASDAIDSIPVPRELLCCIASVLDACVQQECLMQADECLAALLPLLHTAGVPSVTAQAVLVKHYTESEYRAAHGGIGVSVSHCIHAGIPDCVTQWVRLGNTLRASCWHGMDITVELDKKD